MAHLSDNHVTHDYAERIRELLPGDPGRALQLLPQVICHETRMRLAALIAQCWARSDINTAWNAVSCSKLNAADKQVMFNELWS